MSDLAVAAIADRCRTRILLRDHLRPIAAESDRATAQTRPRRERNASPPLRSNDGDRNSSCDGFERTKIRVAAVPRIRLLAAELVQTSRTNRLRIVLRQQQCESRVGMNARPHGIGGERQKSLETSGERVGQSAADLRTSARPLRSVCRASSPASIRSHAQP